MRKTSYKRQLKIREWTLGVSAFLTLGVSVIIPQTASAVSLKPQSTITGDVITLGDVFSGLDHGADQVLGAAPHPGQDMTLTATTLLRIASAMDVPWRPATSDDQITLKRAATIIDRPMIEAALKNALMAHGVEGAFDVTIPAENTEMILPQNTPQHVEVSSLKLIAGEDRFEATLAAPSKQDAQQTITVTGMLSRLISVPVLKEAIQNGDMISAYDLEYIDMPAKGLNHDVVIKEEDLVGLTPRRVLQAGKPIKQGDLQQAKLVDRGELVTVLFNANGLSLTTQGKALQQGGKGDVIRILNASSNKTIEGTITGTKEVTIQSF